MCKIHKLKQRECSVHEEFQLSFGINLESARNTCTFTSISVSRMIVPDAEYALRIIVLNTRVYTFNACEF